MRFRHHDHPLDAGASESDEFNGSNASQVLALGPTFDSRESFASGQALTLMNLLNQKSWPWARLWDALASFAALDALDAEAPEGPGGNLDLMSWGHCRFIWCIRFGRGSESNESKPSQLAPRTFDSDTPPDAGASDGDESNGSNASQVLALGPTLDSLDALDSGQALTLMQLLALTSWPWGRV